MGKVGSNTIVISLKKSGLHPALNIHRINPNNINQVKKEYLDKGQKPPDETLRAWAYKNIYQKKVKSKIITVVREPISRNFSAFFQNFKRFTGAEYEGNAFQAAELIELFLSGYNHNVPLIWFDIEMKKVIGIDIYNYLFPKETGYLIIKKNDFDLLVLKLEVSDVIKQNALAEFLNITTFELKRANVGENKNYSQAYQNFKKYVQLPSSYLEKMLNSKYTKHFYTDTEIEAIWQRWHNKNERLPYA